VCCAIAALMFAAAAAWRSLAKGARAWRLSARWAAAVAAGLVVAAGGSAFAAIAPDAHAGRAENGPLQMLASGICGGSPDPQTLR
jgi:hypothetical protein